MITEMDKYYVYVILRPDKPGTYKYGKYVFTHLPFYVGKGCDNRIKRTLYSYNSTHNKHKQNILKYFKRNNLDPIVEIIKDNIDEQTAFRLETELILTIGRGKNKPLVNQTDGGEGASGHKNKKKQKAIYVFDLMGNFLYEFESSYLAASILNIHASLIQRCLHNMKYKAGGMTYSTGGFLFRFKSEFENKPERIDVSYLNNKKGNGPVPRKVQQLDLLGNVLNTFDSIQEAAIATGCRSSKICMCCRSKSHTHKNYKWQYYEN